MQRMKRESKRIGQIESHDIKLSDGKNVRILRDKETNQIELILDHELLRSCNQGVTSDRYLDQKYQPYVLAEGFYSD